MLVGERPGEQEAARKQPFVGRSGAEQDSYLMAAGISTGARGFYKTNVCKDYAEDNPDPAPADVIRWTPALEQELYEVRPEIVIAVGRFAARWFLGDDVDMDFVHGKAFRRTFEVGGTEPLIVTVCPTYHPAFGFYDEEARPKIFNDYRAAVAAIKGNPIYVPEDEYVGHESYLDVTGTELADIIAGWDPGPFGNDTEGYRHHPWSIQVSREPGTGYVLRAEQADFAVGIRRLQEFVDHPDTICCIHNGMHDIEIEREMGLELFGRRLFDSMYAAYIMRTEPQGLKPLAFRWCGMQMQSYEEVVGDVGLQKQFAYLAEVMDREWPKSEPRLEWENDGTCRLYKPQPVNQRAAAILSDYYNGKRDKQGDLPDPAKRWRKVDPYLRKMVESAMGRFPIGTLADIELADAIRYSGRDPDATLRLFYVLSRELGGRHLTKLMDDGMAVLPIFEEMQSNGMPGRKSYFQALSAEMHDYMMKGSVRISHRYYNDQPFNPASPDKVAAIIRRRGLVPEKRSKKTGKISTAKKSIEHLRYEDEAMEAIIDWREHQKIRDSFADPIAEYIEDTYGEDVDTAPVRTIIKTTRTATRRLATGGISLLAIPVRNELGLRVREGFECEEGYEFGAWDLSQVEMRYMAHLSGDEKLHKFFTEKDPVTGKDYDMHAQTAAAIFGIDIRDVDEMQHRYPAKRAGFGIITNITGAGLLDQLRMFGCKGWDVNKCNNLVEEWLKYYKGVGRFLEKCREEVRATGEVRDVWGMPRYLPGVWSHDRKIAAEAERAASSHKIQGGAQGMIQRAMIWLRDYIRALREAGIGVRWILQVHDEIILKFPIETAAGNTWEMLDPLVREGLIEHSLKLTVPVKCSGNHHPNWSEV